MGDNRCMLITCNRYYTEKFINHHINYYLDGCFFERKDVCNEGFYTFVVVEVEGGIALNHYDNLTKVALKNGAFRIYLIEIFQELEICLKFNKHQRSKRQIKESLSMNTVPHSQTVIDPTRLAESKAE